MVMLAPTEEKAKTRANPILIQPMAIPKTGEGDRVIYRASRILVSVNRFSSLASRIWKKRILERKSLKQLMIKLNTNSPSKRLTTTIEFEKGV